MESIDDILPVGKFKGKTILWVAKKATHYLNWVLESTNILGPYRFIGGTQYNTYNFPFNEMRKHGYYPPSAVKKAYIERGKKDEEYIRQMERGEDELDRMRAEDSEQRDQNRGFWSEEMGSEGYWNID